MYLWPSQSPTALGVDCNHLYINIPFQASQIDTFACSIIHMYILGDGNLHRRSPHRQLGTTVKAMTLLL